MSPHAINRAAAIEAFFAQVSFSLLKVFIVLVALLLLPLIPPIDRKYANILIA